MTTLSPIRGVSLNEGDAGVVWIDGLGFRGADECTQRPPWQSRKYEPVRYECRDEYAAGSGKIAAEKWTPPESDYGWWPTWAGGNVGAVARQSTATSISTGSAVSQTWYNETCDVICCEEAPPPPPVEPPAVPISGSGVLMATGLVVISVLMKQTMERQ